MSMAVVPFPLPLPTRSSPFKPTHRPRDSPLSRRASPDAPPPRSPIPKALIEIHSSGIIACLRTQSAELAVEAARAALTAGISVLEVTMSTPGALQAVKDLSLEFPSSLIGVGTVLNALDAANAVKAGAKFLMSPTTIMEILTDPQRSDDVLYIPGAMTPTEVAGAYDSGAKIVKIYPISVLGGVHYMSVLKKPFAHIPMIASQGINIDSIESYITSGASAVVLSDAIFGREAVRERDFDAIHRDAGLAALRGRQAVHRRDAS